MNQFNKKDIQKVSIRIEPHLQRIKSSGLLAIIRKEFDIPEQAFKTIAELEDWQWNELWKNKETLEKWRARLLDALDCAKISREYAQEYLGVIENYITLDNPGALSVDLPGIPHYRIDSKFLRDMKIMEISDSINPKTGKKYTAEETAGAYHPPEEWSAKKYDIWMKKYDVGSGNAVRKIISRHKKRLLK